MYDKLDSTGKSKHKWHKNVFTTDQMINILKKYGLRVESIYGQSLVSKIIKQGKDCENVFDKYVLKDKNIFIDFAKSIAYPNKIEVNDSYSLIFVGRKV